MNKVKMTTLLAGVAAMSLLIAACGGGGSAPADQSGAAASGDQTLTVWAWDPAFNIYALKEAEKVYQKDHPDFKLDIVEITWDDTQAKLTTLAQSQQLDQLPDIFLMQNNAFQKNVINYPDIFSDFSKAGVDYSQFPASVVAYSTIENVNYGLPFDSGTAIGAYRTDILAQAGLKVDDFKDITWDQLIEKGKIVKEKTGKPLLSTVAGTSDMALMMLQSTGDSMFDKEGNPTIADNATLLKASQIYKELVSSGIMIEKNSWDEYIGSIVNGEVAGVYNGIWISGSIQTAKDQAGKWAVTNTPAMPGIEGATHYTANGGSSWAISSNADVELASDFLKSTFAGSTEFYDTILPSSGAVANWIPAGKSEVYAKPLEFYGNDAIYAKVVEYSSKVPTNNTGVYYYEGRDAISTAFTEIVAGKDPKQALKEAHDKVEFAMK
ncbi:MAG: ABC transporter substrate-binding protein [Actinomycetaceae bacterium]|nr:ABC transporter substrate-binding protein [Actinomycetaceae bacterium]